MRPVVPSLLVLALVVGGACADTRRTTDAGPAGPAGPAGKDGVDGRNGIDGRNGLDGADGRTSLVRTLAEPAGNNCASGGFRVDHGLDLDEDGTLGDAEIEAHRTQYVCNGAKGERGERGETGPAGTFSGTFAGNALFNGPATFNQPVALNGSVTINGRSLFDAVFDRTYPAVLAPGHAASLPSGNMEWLVAGTPVFTAEGEVWLWPSPATSSGPVVCSNPLTYYLSSPATKTIQVTANLDDGPGGVYLNGNVVRTYNGTSTTSITVPAGKFSLSFIACSNNGPSVMVAVMNRFITTFGLQVDYARVFNRSP